MSGATLCTLLGELGYEQFVQEGKLLQGEDLDFAYDSISAFASRRFWQPRRDSKISGRRARVAATSTVNGHLTTIDDSLSARNLQMNAVLGRMASTAQELAHYHSGDGDGIYLAYSDFRPYLIGDSSCMKELNLWFAKQLETLLKRANLSVHGFGTSERQWVEAQVENAKQQAILMAHKSQVSSDETHIHLDLHSLRLFRVFVGSWLNSKTRTYCKFINHLLNQLARQQFLKMACQLEKKNMLGAYSLLEVIESEGRCLALIQAASDVQEQGVDDQDHFLHGVRDLLSIHSNAQVGLSTYVSAPGIVQQISSLHSDLMTLQSDLENSLPEDRNRSVNELLLLPGVHHNIALRSTLLDYNRHWSDSDFHSLTADMLKKEILSLIEHEGVSDNSTSIFCCWKKFCSRYFQNWCKSNALCGLLLDSYRGTFGLIRKNSVSLFRCSENIERLINGISGTSDDLIYLVTIEAGLILQLEVLVKMLRCVVNVSQQLGKTASAIFYESLVSAPLVISAEEITHRLLKNLESGYSSTATSQVAKVMYESAFDILLFLSYVVSISGQIQMLHDDVSKIQLDLIPRIEKIISEWLLIHFCATTPSESAEIEDFSSQLSVLHIDRNMGRRSRTEKLGKCEFTLAFLFLPSIRTSSGHQVCISLRSIPDVKDISISMRDFVSWIIWGHTAESFTFLKRATDLALILLRHGQYDEVEHLLTMVEAHLQKEKTSYSIQDTEGGWCILHHLLGCCFLTQGIESDFLKKVISNFNFKASSGKGTSQALRSLLQEPGSPNLGFTGDISASSWRLHYYQWAMQIFEQYNISEGACQFALAALEEVEEASVKDELNGQDSVNESVSTIKGRLWANVFKFTLDHNLYCDAYSAVISNPDEESKYICLRRLIIVLYERGAIKILCGGKLPFVGLTKKVEYELARKADCSGILAKPDLYKLLYAFEMHQHNWRRAACYMYLYSARLRKETALRDYQHTSLALKEILNWLSAAINALHLVHPANAWIDPLLWRILFKTSTIQAVTSFIFIAAASNNAHPQTGKSYIDIEKIEDEFMLTSAEYLLSLANIKPASSVPNTIAGVLFSDESRRGRCGFCFKLRDFRLSNKMDGHTLNSTLKLSISCIPPLNIVDRRNPRMDHPVAEEPGKIRLYADTFIPNLQLESKSRQSVRGRAIGPKPDHTIPGLCWELAQLQDTYILQACKASVLKMACQLEKKNMLGSYSLLKVIESEVHAYLSATKGRVDAQVGLSTYVSAPGILQQISSLPSDLMTLQSDLENSRPEDRNSCVNEL
ncbi:hypothetical protein PS1_035634 [Malus domestica]